MKSLMFLWIISKQSDLKCGHWLFCSTFAIRNVSLLGTFMSHNLWVIRSVDWYQTKGSFINSWCLAIKMGGWASQSYKQWTTEKFAGKIECIWWNRWRASSFCCIGFNHACTWIANCIPKISCSIAQENILCANVIFWYYATWERLE